MESEILAVWKKQLEAMDAADCTALQACFAPNMTLTHMTGYRQPLNEWLAGIRRREFVYHQVHERSVEITRLDATQAHLVGHITTGVTDDGSGQAWPLRIEQEYRHDGIEWRCSDSRVTLDLQLSGQGPHALTY